MLKRILISLIAVLALAAPAGAAVTTTTSSVSYTCNGSTTTFAVPFRFLEAGHLVVKRVATATGAATNLALSTDYTVVGAGAPRGSVALVAAVKCSMGYTLSIERVVPLTQPTSFRSQSSYSPATHEAALDRLTMGVQQVVREQAAKDALQDADISNLALGTASASSAQVTAGTSTRALTEWMMSGPLTSSGAQVTASGSTTTLTLADWMASLQRMVTTAGVRFASQGCQSNATGSYNLPVTVSRTSTAAAMIAGALISCSSNALRVEEPPRGALIESASSTNLHAAAAETFEHASWTKSQVVVTADVSSAPNGTASADRITKSSTSSTASVGRGINVNAARYAFSIFVKAEGLTTVEIGLYQSGFVPVTGYVLSGPGTGVLSANRLRVTGLSTTEWTRIGIVTSGALASGSSVSYIYPGGVSDGGSGLSLLVWGAQIVELPMVQSYVGAGSRTPDDVSMLSPVTTSDFCLYGRFQPLGREWTAVTSTLLSLGVEGTNNSATLLAGSDGTLKWTIVDAAGQSRGVSIAHSFLPGSAHEIAACVDSAGNPAVWADTTQLSASASGSGSGRITTLPTTLWIGSNGSGSKYLDGYAYDVRTTPGSSPQNLWSATPPKSVARVLWLSDSIYNMPELWMATSASVTSATLTHDTGTYGGTTIGSGLFELADATDAYESSWSARSRGRPFTDYGGLIFEYMRNDWGGDGGTSYRRAYDKLLSQAVARFPKIVSGNCPPRALGDFSGWDLANDGAYTEGMTSVLPFLVAKYGQSHVDTWQRFQDEVTAGHYTVAQLMRDALHPSFTTGASLLGDWIGAGYDASPALLNPTPDIVGTVKNYLFGQPAAGSWAMTTAITSTTSPYVGPLWRVAGYDDRALVASAAGARVIFPAFNATAHGQIWAHFLFDSSTGGTANVYVDRGTATESVRAVNTLTPGVNTYFRSVLVASDVTAGAHTVEIETTSAGPVRVVGVTYVGTP